MKAYKGVAKRRNLLKAFKGFDKRLRCSGFQYEVGKEYQEPEASLCRNGFHACENPLDTFRYYPPTDSRYCEVEIDDNGQRNSEDSKVCGEKIKIVSEIVLDAVIKAGAQFIFEMCKGGEEALARILHGYYTTPAKQLQGGKYGKNYDNRRGRKVSAGKRSKNLQRDTFRRDSG